MDSEQGRFITPDEYNAAPSERQEKIRAMPQLQLGEIVRIKDVKFRVTNIKENGRLMLKMVPNP